MSMLGEFIEQVNVRNSDNAFGEDSVIGISTQKNFIFTKADLSGVSLTSYKKVPKNCFVYVPDTSRRGDKISLAYNNSEKTYLVSSISTVFLVKGILPGYLFLFFIRDEFNRYTRFHSWGSAREVFSFNDMCEVKVSIPEITIQRVIVNIFNVYYHRKMMVEKLKEQMKNICSVLVKGAVGKSESCR